MTSRLKKTTKIMILACVIGLSLLLYPTVSNYWNQKVATQAITTYQAVLDELDEEDYQQIWDSAIAYNAELADCSNQFAIPSELVLRYNDEFNPDGTGIMGYIEIPKLDVSLPVYHGTSDYVLQHAAGHVEWSSFPTGGESTHCIISAHRGLPSAKLFTDLDEMREGDVFLLKVLDQILTYEVDQIRVVLPQEIDDLVITEGQDYCTLVTCTPYGVNTHRLLVRGHRVETSVVNDTRVISEAVKIDTLMAALMVELPLLLILLLMVMFKKPNNSGKKPEIAETVILKKRK